MIKFEPNERASIDELLQHQWFSLYRADYGRQKTRRENTRLNIQLPGQRYLDWSKKKFIFYIYICFLKKVFVSSYKNVKGIEMQ